MKILVVDDAEISVLIATRMLEKFGHEVVSCSNGEEALELLKDGDLPQVIFLDWMMKGLSGIDVCRRIRAATGGGKVFITVLTGRTLEVDRIEAVEAGADLHLAKPLKADELTYVLSVAEKALAEYGDGRSIDAKPQDTSKTG